MEEKRKTVVRTCSSSATFASLATEHQLRMLAVKLLAGRAILEEERKRESENTHESPSGVG